MANVEMVPAVLRAAEKRVMTGTRAPSADPRTLRREEIKENRPLFWPRSLDERGERAMMNFIREMKNAIDGAEARPLDPVLVWWDGEGWCVLDGHLRMDAYRAANWQRSIPVQVFKGTPLAALIKATRNNSRPKLPMSARERSNAAWRIVCMTKERETTAEAIAEASTRGVRLVKSMRAVKRALLSANPTRELHCLDWLKARDEANGTDRPKDSEREEEAEREAREMVGSFLEKYGECKPRHFDSLGRFVELLHAQLPQFLVELWQDDDIDISGLPDY